jgi:hypothetical protein
MSDASPAKRRNLAARLGFIFAGLAVVMSLIIGLAFFSSVAVTGIPDLISEIADEVGGVGYVLVPVLSVAGIVFGIVGAVRSGRLGEGAFAIIAISLGSVFLIICLLAIGLILIIGSIGPAMKG